MTLADILIDLGAPGKDASAPMRGFQIGCPMPSGGI
jgi:hypothetical protein